MAKRIKIGDIIQILTSEGVAYAQVTHKHEEYGHLLRVFEGFYTKEPKDFSEIVRCITQFSTFFPIQTAVNKGLFTVAGNTSVSKANQQFPIFRSCSYGKNGERGPWWLWDGEQEVMLKRDLTEEEKRFPKRGIISAPLLVERTEKGYRVEIDEL